MVPAIVTETPIAWREGREGRERKMILCIITLTYGEELC